MDLNIPRSVVRKRHPERELPFACLRKRIFPDLIREAYLDYLCELDCPTPSANIKAGKCQCEEEREKMLKEMQATWFPSVLLDGQEGKPKMALGKPKLIWRPKLRKSQPLTKDMPCYCASKVPQFFGSGKRFNYYPTCPYYNAYYNCCC